MPAPIRLQLLQRPGEPAMVSPVCSQSKREYRRGTFWNPRGCCWQHSFAVRSELDPKKNDFSHVFTTTGRERKSRTGINGPPCPINSDLEAQQTFGSILSGRGSTSSHGASVLCLLWTLLRQTHSNMDLLRVPQPPNTNSPLYTPAERQILPPRAKCPVPHASLLLLMCNFGYDLCKYLLWWWRGEYTVSQIHNILI